MALIPGMTVPAPERLRRRYGLFDAASGPLDLPAHGEGGGLRFVPVSCGQSRAYGVACYGTGDGETPAPVKPLDGDTAEVETGVFLALATLNCGAVGYRTSEYEAKVRRRLEDTEQASVEEALWTGLDFEDNALGILSLDGEASSITADYDPGLITDVVGALERYAYTTQQYGSVAYIHAPVEVAAFAAEAGLIIVDGQRKVTPMGSVWVFGAYPSGEVIVTGQTTVWRSPDVQIYSSFENASNEVVLVAERAYSVAFECFAGRAEFNPLEGS
jgi:hypothetical protein